MTTPNWITTAGFLTTVTELISTSTSVLASGTGTTYSLICGSLPTNLSLSNTGTISGIPSAVVNITRSQFVVRATNGSDVSDRTFFIDVKGPDDPVWITAPGYLPVGYRGENYMINNQFVDVTVEAVASIPASTKIKYYIADNDGVLPSGLTLDQSGRLYGFVYVDIPNNSPPIKYEFWITATDGISSSRRKFKFNVVDSDFFRVADAGMIGSATTVTTATVIANINSGTKIFKSGVNITATLDINLLSIGDVVTNLSSIGIPTNTKIADLSTNTFTLSTVTTATISSGSVLKFTRTTVESDILSNYNTQSLGISYLQPPQFLNGSDLGTIRANNNQSIDVTAYDAAPFRGTLTYSIVTGTSIYTQLPQGLSLDASSGYIYGFVPYQPAYTQSYSLTVKATKTDRTSTATVTATNTFTLAVKGEVETTIEWVSGSDLGTIETGVTSELYVKAQQLASDYSIKYQLSSGSLPPGLTLARDGNICGAVSYGNTGTYTFTVIASDVYELSQIQRDFKLTAFETTSTEYTKIYFKPFFSMDKREAYRNFISNDFTFDPTLIYRYFDTNFGVQPEIKMILDFGIERVDLGLYTAALRENFYRKHFYFGDVKIAIAKDSTGTVVYELVYIDVIDDMTNNLGDSVNAVIHTNNEIYYPGSVENMRGQLKLIPLEDGSYISVREDLQPKFMKTAQEGSYTMPGYMRVIPLCYALPGQGSKIISRIKISGFDFKLLDFEIDRIIVENSADSASAKYLIFERQSMGDTIETDNYLFGLDYADTPELTVRLDDESGNPITRN